MDQIRFARVQALFHEALERHPEERDVFLRRECGGDDGLFEDVRTMLSEDIRSTSLLDQGVALAAQGILGDSSSTSRHIGPYRLLRMLGEGGMGTVWLAERADLGSPAAIKILRDAWISPSRRDRFILEQRTLARLAHPAIARLLDAGALPNGTPWIVMEYVDGTPITDHARLHALPVTARLRLVRAVAEGVQHAHQHLIIHRDLKPSNVLVTTDGSVKLLDFGIAKQLDVPGTSADTTRTSMRMLTPAYAAPEQIRGDQVGLHTDVYGLGTLLYELLTGCMPYGVSSSTPAVMETLILAGSPELPSRKSAAHGAPPDVAGLHAGAWADLDVLCMTAMHVDPARRYSTADAFIRDIDHYLKGEPLESRPDTLSYRAGKFVRRNRIRLAVAAAVLTGVVALTTFYTVRLARARDAALVETARARRMQALMSNLLTGGEDATAPAESLRVVDVLDRGVLEAENLSSDPVIQSDMFHTLGSLYQSLGRFTSAESLLGRALERRKSIFGSDSAEAGTNMVAVGMLKLEQGKMDDAERLVRDGLAMTRRHLSPDDQQVARALTSLGRVLEERGGYPEAIRVLEDAVRLHSLDRKPSADLASSLRHLGNVHFYAGNLDRANDIFERSLEMTRQVNGERHALVADDLINLGAVRFERGRYAESEQFYRQALAITEAWYGPDHHMTASNLTMLGRALNKEDRYDEAVTVLKRSLSIQERVFGPVHSSVASAVNELGTIALQRARYDEAEAAFHRMSDIYRSIYPDGHYLTGIAISNLASVYNARLEFARAEPVFREAVVIYSTNQSPTHLNTGIARIKLGRALLGQQRYSEAEAEILRGYDIVSKQTSPSVSWLKAAREDLVKLYVASGQAAKAVRYRAELAATDPAAQAR